MLDFKNKFQNEMMEEENQNLLFKLVSFLITKMISLNTKKGLKILI